ncbi:MarR family transcriptional regulator [Kitasatospora sp. NPDC056327]|uniref:GbsR/MarR family transcriptional regulator n=1 Tax=Kitasatospora sp. NPDC056327 TaxID=3345785 RepID=UPI0035D8516F
MPGGRLTGEDRRNIAEGLTEGLGYAEIGRRLGRPASTIMREVARNGGPGDYGAARADEATQDRARRRRQPRPAEHPAPDGGYGRDPRAVQDFTDSFIALLARSGLPRMEARVLGSLYVSETGALTAADLVRRLRVSPASVSNAVAFLEQHGLLRREREPGERRERYVADDDIWLRSLLGAAQMNGLLADMARRGAEVLGPDTPAGARFDSSAELFVLLSESMRELMETCRRHLAGRRAEQAAPPRRTAPPEQAERPDRAE